MAPSHPMSEQRVLGASGAGSCPESVSEVSLALLNISESFLDSFLPFPCLFFFLII